MVTTTTTTRSSTVERDGGDVEVKFEEFKTTSTSSKIPGDFEDFKHAAEELITEKLDMNQQQQGKPLLFPLIHFRCECFKSHNQ